MAGPSNLPPHVSPGTQELYLHALNANVSNFVSVKLSSNDNYRLWRKQMLCLMETHDMCCLVDVPFDRSTSTKIMKQYDSLLKGWIFGSISQEVLGTVVDLGSAKDVWDKLKSFYAPNSSFQQAQLKPEAKEETKDKGISTEIETKEETKGKGISTEIETKEETKGKGISTEIETKEETKGKGISTETKEDHITTSVEPVSGPGPTGPGPTGPGPTGPGPTGPGQMNPPTAENIETGRQKRNSALKENIKRGYWYYVGLILDNRGYGPLKLDPINEEESTILHLAVEKGKYYIIERVLRSLQKEDVKEALEMKNVHGNTALHVAAIHGKERAARLLIQKHDVLLKIPDNLGNDPLSKACSTLQFDTCLYFLKVLKTKNKKTGLTAHHIEMGVELVVNAISAKQYSTASNFVRAFPEVATENDQVLMAIARTFPSGQSHEETDTCPDLGVLGENIIKSITRSFFKFILYWWRECYYQEIHISDLPKMLLSWVWQLIFFLISIVFLPFVMLYFLLRKGAAKLGSYVNRSKKMEWEEAKKVLKLVCNEIDKLGLSGIHHPKYKRPILEAACQNAFEVVDEILSRSGELIWCQDECGHDIIQLTVIHRSDKIYNRIYQNGEDNNQNYKTIKDSSQNNMLHLAGRLAPSHKLNGITGAALQLQRELQWREELKKFVFPSYITQENIYKETPGMVFTREHENLVKEGEKWMKTTAESCSITAGLITTIVFAAAITVPGGSDQKEGTPLFTHEIAFIIFAISDAVSLLTSTITLLVFLSILTTRFSEQDFLVRLPSRLIIGLSAFLVSTTAMMVAFGAILFLVFSNRKPWMLVPICASICITIIFSFFIQIPLIVDLRRSTNVPIFSNKTNSQEDRFDLYEFVAHTFFY